MVHYSAISNIVEAKGAIAPPKFDIEFVDKKGARTLWRQIVCTSSRFRPRTINIMSPLSKEVRKIRLVSVISINDMEVYV